MLKFKITKKKSTMEMSVWEKKINEDQTVEFVNKAILEIAPALPNTPPGPPKAGVKYFDYTKKIKISFNPTDMLKVAYKLTMMSFGNAEKYTKYGDMSKVAGSTSTEKKSLTITNFKDQNGESVINENGSVTIMLSQDKDNYVNIVLDRDEAYALAKWFECTYSKLYNNSEAAEENE